MDILTDQFKFDEEELKEIKDLLLEKSHARDIYPEIHSLEQEEIVNRAKSEWETLGLELDELPDFDECFKKVNAFYKSLPWD